MLTGKSGLAAVPGKCAPHSLRIGERVEDISEFIDSQDVPVCPVPERDAGMAPRRALFLP